MDVGNARHYHVLVKLLDVARSLMPTASFRLPVGFMRRFNRGGTKSRLVRIQVANLSEYFAVLAAQLKGGDQFWFGGHADAGWSLTPGALRFDAAKARKTALDLIYEFKRAVELRIEAPSGRDAELRWVQLAQHYGLPTRLLDWTRNAAIALYFACLRPDVHGAVYVLSPMELNSHARPRAPRVFDADRDMPLIEQYLALDGYKRRTGMRTIAIEPTWNSERIMLQQGCFTLHGSREFALTWDQARSLCCIPILHDAKRDLLTELSNIGVRERFIFPEPEHVCSDLKRGSGLAD